MWYICLNLQLWPGFRITLYCTEADIPWALGLWFFLEGTVWACVHISPEFRLCEATNSMQQTHAHVTCILACSFKSVDWAICPLCTFYASTTSCVCMFDLFCNAISWLVERNCNVMCSNYMLSWKLAENTSQRKLGKKNPTEIKAKLESCSYKTSMAFCCLNIGAAVQLPFMFFFEVSLF